MSSKWIALSFACVACAGGHSVDWVLDDSHPDLPDDIRSRGLVVRVLEGGCSGRARLFEQNLASMERARRPPRLPSGQHGFWAAVLGDGCETIVARGCVEVDPASVSAVVTPLELCSGACRCDDCCGADAGRVPPDAGSDSQGGTCGHCDDGNPCTDDTCDDAGRCQFLVNEAPCDDTNFCNGPDVCAEGRCAPSGEDPCSAGTTCNEMLGACVGCVNDADCPGDAPGGWTTCAGFSEPCGQMGTQTRSVTMFACVSNTCVASVEEENRSCSRSTTGLECRSETCGSFGLCGGFSSTCDEGGTRSRTCTRYTCQAGSCQNAGTRDETEPCTRDTDGTGCETDGLFCNGVERCRSGACRSEMPPCSGACDEATNRCFTTCGPMIRRRDCVTTTVLARNDTDFEEPEECRAFCETIPGTACCDLNERRNEPDDCTARPGSTATVPEDDDAEWAVGCF